MIQNKDEMENKFTPIAAYRKDDEKVWYLVLPDSTVYTVYEGKTEKIDLTLKEGKRIYEKLYTRGSKAQVNGYTVVSDGFVFP